jgi:hypothetical protein
MASCQLDDLIDLAEVKGLRNVGIEKADGIGVGVNRDHAKTEVPRASNRIHLGNTRAEEEHAGQLGVRLRGSGQTYEDCGSLFGRVNVQATRYTRKANTTVCPRLREEPSRQSCIA